MQRSARGFIASLYWRARSCGPASAYPSGCTSASSSTDRTFLSCLSLGARCLDPSSCPPHPSPTKFPASSLGKNPWPRSLGGFPIAHCHGTLHLGTQQQAPLPSPASLYSTLARELDHELDHELDLASRLVHTGWCWTMTVDAGSV